MLPELLRLELTKPLDRAGLIVYCTTWGRYVRATREIERYGFDGPQLRAAETASKELRAWAQEFGLTPSAESRVAAKAQDAGEDTAFD